MRGQERTLEEVGREFGVTADVVVICAGVWTDLVYELAGVRAGYRVRMSKGVHVVVPRETVRADTGMIVRTDKSVLFFIPWGEFWIVGTTDTDWSGDRAEPAATEEAARIDAADALRRLLYVRWRHAGSGAHHGARTVQGLRRHHRLRGI